MQPITVVIAMIVWTAIAFVIALAARKGMGRGASEFFLGGRRIGGFISGMTYAATTYSAFMLVGLVGLTYRRGVGALGFEMTYLIFTVILLVVFGPRFWIVGKKHGHITPPELLGFRYENKWVSFTAAIISFVMLIPYSSIQLIGAGVLVSGLTGGQIPFMAGVLIMALLSGVTAIWAGMRSVSWTDAVQAVTMIVTSLIAVFFVFQRFFGGTAEFFMTIEQSHADLLAFDWSPQFFIGLTLPWAFFALTNPQVSQRLFIPDRLRSMRRMILYFAVFGFLYTIISTIFGFAAAEIVPGLENSDTAMPELLSRLPTALSLVLFVGIFAAASSTLGSIILTLSSLFTQDVVKIVRPGLSERAERVTAQMAMIVLLGLCIGFASLQLGFIANLASMASGGLLVMAPAIIGAFFWKQATAAGALVSMIGGAAVTGVLYLTGFAPLGWGAPVWGAGITTALFIVVSLITTAPGGGAAFVHDLESELEARRLR